MPAKYVIARKGDRYHWNLLATNGKVIATSEVYNGKQAAMAGIRLVQRNGATDVIVTAEELAEAKKPAAKRAPAKKAAVSTSRSARTNLAASSVGPAGRGSSAGPSASPGSASHPSAAAHTNSISPVTSTPDLSRRSRRRA